MFDATFIRAGLLGLFSVLTVNLHAAGTAAEPDHAETASQQPSATLGSGDRHRAGFAPYYLFAVSASYLESPFATEADGDTVGAATAD